MPPACCSTLGQPIQTRPSMRGAQVNAKSIIAKMIYGIPVGIDPRCPREPSLLGLWKIRTVMKPEKPKSAWLSQLITQSIALVVCLGVPAIVTWMAPRTTIHLQKVDELSIAEV
ncbi:MAG: hypothetical protein ACK53L_25130, partial [Pirellulaceae bacterium]